MIKTNIPKNDPIIKGNIKIAHWMGAELAIGFCIFDLNDTPDPSNRTNWAFHMLQYHKNWDWIMTALEKLEEDEDFFTLIINSGKGVHEFRCNKYYSQLMDTSSYSFPDGIEVRSDVRASDFENQRIECIWRGLQHFIDWKIDEGELLFEL